MVTHTIISKLADAGAVFNGESRLKQDNIFIGGVCAEDENFGGDTSDTFDGKLTTAMICLPTRIRECS